MMKKKVKLMDPVKNNKEVKHVCETCKWGSWKRNGYDATMMDDECGGCCSFNDKWVSKDEE